MTFGWLCCCCCCHEEKRQCKASVRLRWRKAIAQLAPNSSFIMTVKCSIQCHSPVASSPGKRENMCKSLLLFCHSFVKHSRILNIKDIKKSTKIFFMLSCIKVSRQTNISLLKHAQFQKRKKRLFSSEAQCEATLCDLVAMTMLQRATLAIPGGKPLLPASHWELETSPYLQNGFQFGQMIGSYWCTNGLPLLYPHFYSLEMTVWPNDS